MSNQVVIPEPVKIGANTTVWREDDVRALIEELCQMRKCDNSYIGSKIFFIKNALKSH